MRWTPVPHGQMMEEARAAGVAQGNREDQGEKYGSRIIQKQERLGGWWGGRWILLSAIFIALPSLS